MATSVSETKWTSQQKELISILCEIRDCQELEREMYNTKLTEDIDDLIYYMEVQERVRKANPEERHTSLCTQMRELAAKMSEDEVITCVDYVESIKGLP